MLDELTEKQIRDRIRHLSDRMDDKWKKIEPDLQEFDKLKSEFDDLFIELDRRGLLNVTTQPDQDNWEINK